MTWYHIKGCVGIAGFLVVASIALALYTQGGWTALLGAGWIALLVTALVGDKDWLPLPRVDPVSGPNMLALIGFWMVVTLLLWLLRMLIGPPLD